MWNWISHHASVEEVVHPDTAQYLHQRNTNNQSHPMTDRRPFCPKFVSFVCVGREEDNELDDERNKYQQHAG